MMRKRIVWMPLLAVLGAGALGCETNTLTRAVPRIRLVPEPEGFQVALADPAGIDLGQVPLYGLGRARFRIVNDSSAVLKINSAEIRDPSGGTFTIETVSTEVLAVSKDVKDGELVVSFVPEARDVPGFATIALATNAGDRADLVAEAQVRGLGLWVGVPNLEICYGGQCYPQAGNCADRGDGKNVCTLGPLAFGNVPLGDSATQSILLRNLPPADTCLLPPGSPDCTPVCRLTVAKDPAGFDIGFGFAPADAGFAVSGNVPLPFSLDPKNLGCRAPGELQLRIDFAAGDVERDVVASLTIESDDPDSPYIQIPVTAAARQAPVAVAEFLGCDTSPPPNCTVADQVQPLQTVYLDGTKSFDPRDPGDPTLIRSYQWLVMESPLGANPDDFRLTGETSSRFSMWLPLAGRYLVRLGVANELGIASGVSATSDLVINAIPKSRVHLQLVWDHPTNDQDLHLTYATVADAVCDSTYDCFWGNCKPSCPGERGCRDTLPHWFSSSPPREGPNPRLDIDDTNGVGPENINVDSPAAGKYRIYVHYYGNVDLTNVPTQATVRVYIDTLLQAEYRRSLSRNDLWRVAEITWRDDGSADVVEAHSDGAGPGQVKTMGGCTGGFNFGPWF
ncbi:MAG: YfaP family protein [Deltaproteobacteria bacterium]|nr:YfaP family protein [Deltaproteobacteria bacterium]